jgi:hypothetical protein
MAQRVTTGLDVLTARNILNFGVKYFPASNHYRGHAMSHVGVVCDQCGKTNLAACSGYENKDICGACFDSLAAAFTTPHFTNPELVTTPVWYAARPPPARLPTARDPTLESTLLSPMTPMPCSSSSLDSIAAPVARGVGGGGGVYGAHAANTGFYDQTFGVLNAQTATPTRNLGSGAEFEECI